MAKLSAKGRSKVKTSNFAIPSKAKTATAKKKSGNYPIPDRGHAQSALTLVSRYGTPAEKKQVRAAVKRKFGMGGSKKTTTRSRMKPR